MTELIFKGTVITDNKNEFLNHFYNLLQTTNSQFKGQCNAIEFEDVEFIEE